MTSGCCPGPGPPPGFVRGARFVLRSLGAYGIGKRPVGIDGALASPLMHIVRNQRTLVWLSAPIVDLVVEDGAVVGAVVERDGRRRRVRTRRGVVLAAGGFANNTEWRQKYHGVPGPMWLISDVRRARRYLNTALLGHRKEWAKAGLLVEAPSPHALATEIGVDPERLDATVERFNGFARIGVDEDFGRGRTVYDNYYGDPRGKPNPNLGALERGPFRAVRVHPGDLGTKGGLLTDEHARVLREDGTEIPGLYAVGNTTASVMGRTYPGPGSTIAPAVVFGYRAALHVASR
ncbi:FAD-binding protein [Streptosporangium sp. NPDC023615]|uniref:FAD-binding protein n=1 Tax=Streptosporangium sp. NPDC023615 TaxID=3154794 RepID=UPI003427AA12